jgi:hypothetical protein
MVAQLVVGHSLAHLRHRRGAGHSVRYHVSRRHEQDPRIDPRVRTSHSRQTRLALSGGASVASAIMLRSDRIITERAGGPP